MKYVIATMDRPYYLWQVLVQINNFRKLGIEQDAHFVIGCFREDPSDQLMKMVLNEDLKCSISVYNDERRGDEQYSSTLRLNVLKAHFEYFPELQKETFMYLDPDVLFTRPFNYGNLEKDDCWYVSDTRSYLDSKYIKSKGKKLFIEMCNIIGIDPALVEHNDAHAGGAQYIMKNVTPEFWEKCENDSEELYKHMKATESIYNPKHPIQAWTADMWAVLWNRWINGEAKIAPEMDFCWASDMMEKWESKIIFHNAGVTGNGIIKRNVNGELIEYKHFSKELYQVSPFNQDIEVSQETASFKYLQEIRETQKNFPELLF